MSLGRCWAVVFYLFGWLGVIFRGGSFQTSFSIIVSLNIIRRNRYCGSGGGSSGCGGGGVFSLFLGRSKQFKLLLFLNSGGEGTFSGVGDVLFQDGQILVRRTFADQQLQDGSVEAEEDFERLQRVGRRRIPDLLRILGVVVVQMNGRLFVVFEEDLG